VINQTHSMPFIMTISLESDNLIIYSKETATYLHINISSVPLNLLLKLALGLKP
jgi:hypothetical protein